MAGAFGPLFDAWALEQQVLQVLAAWGPDYLRAVRVQRGDSRGWPAPSSWTVTNDLDFWPGDSIPAGLLFSGGNPEPLDKRGAEYAGWWRFGLAIKVKGANQQQANEYAKGYAAAYRALVAHRGDFAGAADGLRALRESYDEVKPGRHRYAAAALVSFELHVAEVLDALAGPLSPTPLPDQDHPDLPTVLTTNLTVNRSPIPEA